MIVLTNKQQASNGIRGNLELFGQYADKKSTRFISLSGPTFINRISQIKKKRNGGQKSREIRRVNIFC